MTQAIIRFINATPSPTPAELALLRSGFDGWSRLRWPALAAKLTPGELAAIIDRPDRAAVARWRFRGLATIELAIAKVEADAAAVEQHHAEGRRRKEAADAIG